MKIFFPLFSLIISAFSYLPATDLNNSPSLETRFNRANVGFEVVKESSALMLTGRENGIRTFSKRIYNWELSNFTELEQHSFFLKKRVEGNLLWRYTSETGAIFELLVQPNGNITLLDALAKDTNLEQKKCFALKTSEILENKGDLAFYDLVTSAQQFHNYGTLQAYTCFLAQNYLFNNGVLCFGKIPEEAMSFEFPMLLQKSDAITPNYRAKTIENYGMFITNGRLNIEDGLNYFEHGISDFDSLQMSNGDINLSSPSQRQATPEVSSASVQMNVRGSLTGTIRNFFLEDHSIFTGNTLSLSPVQNFQLGNQATFHSTHGVTLNVNNLFSNKGILSSGDSIDLQVNDNTDDFGILIAKEKLDTLLKKQHETKQALEQERSHRGAFIAKKKITHIDKYLNTITNHYNVTQDEYGREISRQFSHRTETGYIFQGRETREEESTVPPEILADIQQKNQHPQQIHRAIEGLEAMLSALQKEIIQATKDYNRELIRSLMKAGGTASDIYALTHDPLLKLLQKWDDLSDETQEIIEVERPEFVEISRFTSDVREWTAPFMEDVLNSNAFRITRDILTSVAAVAILAGDLFPPTAMTTSGLTSVAVSAITTRLFPLAQRVSQVIGGADAFQKVTTFLNEMKDNRSNAREGRLSNTPEERRQFIQKRIENGTLQKGDRFGDKQSYEFVKKEGKFKKGDYLMEDRLHHELEWFSKSKKHKGAIEPKTGTQYKPADPRKNMR